MTLLLAVLGASLLGSVHCAAMCGGFVCLYAGTGTSQHAVGRRSVEIMPHAAYNAGRLVSYLTLGMIAGSIGRGVNELGTLVHVSRLAAIVSGAVMVLWGSSTLLAALGVRAPRFGVPDVVQATFGSVLIRLRASSGLVRGGAMGLLTTLIPCGWLYAFVATAGGTGNVGDAVLVMTFFWLGTLPMMAAVGAGAQRAFGSFRRRLPLVAAGVAVALGLLSMAGRLSVRPTDHAMHGTRVAEASHDRH